jgi:outer membrane protein TolC
MKGYFKIALIAAVTLFFLFPARGSSADDITPENESVVTLQSLIKDALKESPKINEARYRWEAAIEKIPQVGSLPDPMVSFTYFPEPIETRLGPNDSRIMLSQMVPYPKKLSLKEDIAVDEVRIAELFFNKDIRNVITSLTESYFELLYIQKVLKLTEQNKDILEQLSKIAATDYAADSTTLNDVLTAQSNLAQLNYDYLLLLELKETETAKISGILNRSPESAIGELEAVTVEFGYDINEVYELFKKNQEELKIIDANIKKAEKAEELADLSSYPDFKFGLLYSQIGTPDGAMQPEDAGRDAYGVTVGITLPIWSDKNNSKVREKALKKRAMMERKSSHINMTNSKVKALYFKMTNAKRLMELYEKTLIPQAETTMTKAEEWYKKKNSSFAEVLETQSVYYNFSISYQRAAADYNKYAVKLKNLMGIKLIYDNRETKEGE